MSLRTKQPPVRPRLNPRRAMFVLSKIDEILAWEKRVENNRDTKFVELGKYLCEVRVGQYWRVENLKSFDDFLERRFPDSRRTAYYLMSIHEHLPPQVRKELKQVGWTKAAELTKVARSDGKDFDCAAWMHKACFLPRDEFKREVDKHLTGKDSEPTEVVYFKLYRSQIPVIEQAIETAAMMLGSDKSRGYCLEMICADFLAGANLDQGDPEILLKSVSRLYKFLPIPDGPAGRDRMSIPSGKRSRTQLDRKAYQELCRQVLQRDGWRCQQCGGRTNLQVHHIQLRSQSGRDTAENLISLCSECHRQIHLR